MSKAKGAVGRPSSFTPELEAEICFRMQEGESAVSICRSDHMPSLATLWRWTNDGGSFRDNYATARQRQADTYFEQIIDLGDTVNTDGNCIAKAKLQSDNRKWVLARMNRAKYGDKTALDLGNQPDNPLTTSPEASTAFAALDDTAKEEIRKAIYDARTRGSSGDK